MKSSTKQKPGYKNTPLGWIPEDWEIRELNKIANTYSGGTPRRDKTGYYNGTIPWIKSGELNQGYITNVEEMITDEGLNNSSAKMIEKNSLVIALYGATAGIPAISGIKAAINQAILAIIPVYANVENQYLFYWFKNNRELLIKTYCQGGQPNLSAEIIKSVIIPLPPLPEQKAIAKLLSTWDRALELTQELIKQKELRKKYLMQQLLTGKKRLNGFSGDWKTYKLGDLGQCLRGVSFDTEKDIFQTENDQTIRLFRSNNVQNNKIEAIDILFVNKERVKAYQILQNDDIVICMANGSKELVGKAAQFTNTDSYKYTFGAFMGCFRVKDFNKKLANYFFQTTKYRKYIADLHSGSSINNLKPSDIESIKVSVPEVLEQEKISNILSKIDREIEINEKYSMYLQLQKKGLMQQLLTGKKRIKIKEC